MRRGPLAMALLPFAWLYGALGGLRQMLYRVGALDRYRAPVPVLVVGNVLAGGAGKTPTVITLVQHLQSRGWAVGVVSRGYGRTSDNCREVTQDSEPDDVGDEPVLIRQHTRCPVFVARDRPQAVRALLQRYPATTLVICDDGLQHLALHRDLEIIVFDGRGLGNGWLLPAGPLREAWPRASKVPALILHTGAIAAFGGSRATRQLADAAITNEGGRVALDSLAGSRLHAVAGIAQPQAFFAMLRARGLELSHCEALPDHYDFNSWKPSADKDTTLLCTEKDARKLWRKAPWALAVPLELHLEAPFLTSVDSALDQLPLPPSASHHGQKTA